jgi:hypothetical protein
MKMFKFIGVGGHVATAFLVTLKLVDAISWPWLWVLSPSICLFGLGTLFLFVAGIAALIHKWLMRDPNYRLQRRLEDLQRALRRR